MLQCRFWSIEDRQEADSDGCDGGVRETRGTTFALHIHVAVNSAVHFVPSYQPCEGRDIQWRRNAVADARSLSVSFRQPSILQDSRKRASKPRLFPGSAASLRPRNSLPSLFFCTCSTVALFSCDAVVLLLVCSVCAWIFVGFLDSAFLGFAASVRTWHSRSVVIAIALSHAVGSYSILIAPPPKHASLLSPCLFHVDVVK